MIHGTYSVKRVITKSTCRITSKGSVDLDSKCTVHSSALMPGIPFGKSKQTPTVIDSSIFTNGKKTKLKFPKTTKCQNYLTTVYTNTREESQHKDGAVGDKFTMTCDGGDPNNRSFK